MPVNYFTDDPDDRHHLRNCEICARADLDDFADPDDAEDFDDLDDPADPGDDLTIGFAFDLDGMKLACVHTGGLWRAGIPELYLQPPAGHLTGDRVHDARLAVFLATGLIQLGYRLLAADDFDVPPYWADFDGRRVRFWIDGEQMPPDRLAPHLDPEVDTVLRVDCSLWHRPVLGDG